ncbi:MAG: tetratricopeptide repeat protein [Chloroflexota bacterium]
MDEQVTLTGYADQVRELIRNDRNDEAVAICKHILRYYPKCVDAYRQLGQALLEKGQFDDAKEIFRRVLSADPESVVAYAGLAVILEQEHLVAEAAWHMERAYELAPSNTELHKELHRLYHEMDGRPRARLELTPGALARLYFNEGRYTQAIQELNTLVAADGGRFDAHVALAEILWRVGQMRQAAEIAQTLLDRLPYCLKANLILGAVWKETGLSESDQYLQRAQALDPTNQTAQRLFGAHSPLPLTQARVPRYVEGAPIPSAPIEVSPSEEPTEAARATEAPVDVSFQAARESALFGTPAFKPPVTDANLPPWLRMPAPGAVEEPVEPAAEIPTELVAPPQPVEPIAGTPEIVAPPRPVEPVAEIPAETIVLPKQAEEPQPEPPAESDTGVPTWLAQLRQSAEPESPVEPVGEAPAWLTQLRQSAEPAAETPVETPVEQAEETSGELPPWLRAEPRAEETAPAAAPSWIEEAKSAEAAEAPFAATEEFKSEKPTPTLAETPLSDQELPPWFSQPAQPTAAAPIEEPVPAQPESALPTEQLPPWLRQPAQPTVAAPIEEPFPVQPESAPRAEELPPWLSQPTRPAEPAPLAAPAAPKRRKIPTRGDSHLILARTYRDAHQMNEALAEYDYVVQKAPRLVRQVIEDLEVLVKRRDVPVEVHRILGDAYTRADRLAEALEEYRFVLGRVST